MSLPRILYAGTFPPQPGGSGVVAGYFLGGLHDSGYPLSVVTPSSPETVGRADLVRRVYPGIALIEVPAARAPVMPWNGPLDDPEKLAQVAKTQTAFIMEAERFGPDIIFVGREDFLHSVLPWATAQKIPVVCRATGGAVLLDGVYGAAARQLVFGQLQRADVIIAPARHVATRLAEHGLGAPITIRNPVDLSRFRDAPVNPELAARVGLTPDDVVVAHVSTLKPVKRTHDIVDAAAAAVNRDPRLVFLIIGDGADRTMLVDSVRKSGLQDRFRFTGWLDHAAVAAHLRLADMALMTSSTEGMSAAYLEAMASSLPLLASNIAAAREVVEHGQNGFLFPVGDVDAIADLIVDVAADPTLRRRVGGNARAYVERNHCPEAAIDQLRDVITDLLRPGHPDDIS